MKHQHTINPSNPHYIEPNPVTTAKAEQKISAGHKYISSTQSAKTAQ